MILAEKDVRRVTSRFARLAEQGAASRFWYQDAELWARRTVGSRSGLLLACLAATSPRASITANVRHARRAMADIVSGGPLSGGYGVPANDGNVARLQRGEPLAGPKVRPFAEALAGCGTSVPTDVWMLRASGLASGSNSPTVRQRRIVEAACRRLARRLGWAPREVQAAVWAAARSNAGDRHGTASYATAWEATA